MHVQLNQSESSKLEQNNIIPYEKFVPSCLCCLKHGNKHPNTPQEKIGTHCVHVASLIEINGKIYPLKITK